MPRPLRHAVLAAFAALLAAAPAAAADGLPLAVEDTGPTGIADPDAPYRYVSVDVGERTLIARTVTTSGAISRTRLLDGDFTIPAVGLDGSPSGLSANGERLVVIRPRPRFPRETTEFALLETAQLKPLGEIRLDGDFSFDAISPDGKSMYLIEYISPRDPSEYRVRRYDLERRRLVPGAIVDPDEEGEEMYGWALSRETSPDGRWAYTLYLGNEHPFVHALDTVRATAVCIDLHSLEGVRDIPALGLDIAPDGASLIVNRRGEPAATVDTESFEVGGPPSAALGDAVAAGRAEDPATASEPLAWVAGALGLVGALGAVLLLGRRRAGRRPPADPFSQEESMDLAATGARNGSDGDAGSRGSGTMHAGDGDGGPIGASAAAPAGERADP